MLKFSLTSLKYRYFLRSISVTALFIAGLCKVVYTPLISFLVIIALFSIKQTKRILRAILLTIVIFASMWALNEKIVSSLQLTQSFPQQQPMILDLASLYCWGTSLQSNNDARLGLEPLKRNGYPSESICSSVEPMGWDTLRTDRPAWQYSSPILPLYQFQDYKNLMSKWKDAIIHNPNEYIQIKLIHSLQVLTMANAIGPRVEREFSQFNLPNLAVAMVSKYTLIARLLDKVRLFSLGALILVLLLTFAWMTGKEARSFNFDLSQFTFIISLLSFAVFQMLIITFAFVSSNGRYSFPFVFIGLILLIIHVTKFKKEVEGPAKFFADN
jgi:hypothetical protein